MSRLRLAAEGWMGGSPEEAQTMAKQGQHNDDDHDQDKSKGHNNPSKSVEITTGTPKKQETYREQIAHHESTNKPAQHDKNEWNEDTHRYAGSQGTSAHRADDRDRSGSHSDESRR